MKYMKILLLLLALGAMAACSSDNDEPEVVLQAARVQVMTVFAPGQLGDKGYADRVMKGVNTLMKGGTGADSVEVNFIASYDVETTRSMLADWAGRKTSSLDGAPYSRRLVVLTEPFMVQWLAEVKSRLTETDEVLLLKVSGDDVEAAAQALGIGSRVHGLNISAASAVRHFEQVREQYYETTGEREINTNVVRLYGDNIVSYRDSISETILEVSPDLEFVPTKTIVEQGGEVYSTQFQSSTFQTAYEISAFLWAFGMLGDSRVFTVLDLGSANSGAEFFLMAGNQDMRVIMLTLDTEPNTVLHRFAITRYFDRALAEWTQRWHRQPAAGMPRMELHGGWDGYCTDDIDPSALVQIQQ